jgi:hypothetical protein
MKSPTVINSPTAMPNAPFDVLEQAYDDIAAGIDIAGPSQETVFLAKLALALANHIRDPQIITTCIATALQNLKH